MRSIFVIIVVGGDGQRGAVGNQMTSKFCMWKDNLFWHRWHVLCSQGSIITAVAGLKYGPRDTLVRWGILESSCWILLFNPGLSEEREVWRHHHDGYLEVKVIWERCLGCAVGGLAVAGYEQRCDAYLWLGMSIKSLKVSFIFIFIKCWRSQKLANQEAVVKTSPEDIKMAIS